MAEALAEKAKKASQVTATPSTSQVNSPSSSTTPATSLRASMKRELSKRTSQSEMTVKSLLDLELSHYSAEASIGLDDDPLKFWREIKSNCLIPAAPLLKNPSDEDPEVIPGVTHE
ncbi:unnamed protein product [Bemisia tabaci]|uniref:Uncharacterized protein n=1 Tax=Bemisia tabaci TaxID=7038 RepID=A0A9N9ZWG9_BEMTA|nr:unnamed protein product [Bemisia tabaci]